jgi:serine O-acetyltransferase
MRFCDDEAVIDSTGKLLLHQLSNFWTGLDEEAVKRCVKPALEKIWICFDSSNNKYLRKNGELVFSPLHTVTWTLFLYRLSRELAVSGALREADSVYYLNKIMNSVDWYHAIELPVYMMAEHPVGSILGRAKYGEYFSVLQGTTVGGNGYDPDGNPYYPTIGRCCTMYANSTMLGKCVIGDNVLISAGAYLINEVIPSNCIVFGKSPDIIVKERSPEEMKSRFSRAWIL